jgi:uncharacterized protein (DUF1697 family)
MPTYIAFLRGINVGGNNKVAMEDVKKAFALLKFENVKTILASGNIIFTAPKHTNIALGRKISASLFDLLKCEIEVVIRSFDEIKSLADAQPFKKVKITPDTRLYVTFLAEPPKTQLTAPWTSPEKDLKILTVSASEIVSVVTVNPSRNSTDAMAFIEKQCGRKVTTRNWNTIEKILKAA